MSDLAKNERRAFAWTMAASLAAGGLLAWLWRLSAPPSLPGDPWWYAGGWVALLAGPSAARLAGRPWPEVDTHHTFSSLGFAAGAWLSLAAFLLLLGFHQYLGNYKLWLGLVYLGAASLRLGGLSQVLEARLAMGGAVGWRTAAAGAALSAGAGLLLLPWLRPDLGESGWWELGRHLAAAFMWGGGAGGFLFAASRLGGPSRRGLWLAFLAFGLGPPPVLAVAWLPLAATGLWLAVWLVAVLMAARWRKDGRPPREPAPLPLYWLVRALMILWWGLGLALALALAWWRPEAGRLLGGGVWLRAILVGAFMVGSLGLLGEYSLPLFRRANADTLARPRKVLGILASALALSLALGPLLLMEPHAGQPVAGYIWDRSRAELLADPTELGPDKERLQLAGPTWLSDVSRVFVVGYIEGGAALPQGQPVLQLTAVDQLDLPHFYALRAGVDLAERDLGRRDLAARARHTPARVARVVTRYTARGEAYPSREYFTGLYLGQSVEHIKTITLRYINENPPETPAPRVRILRVFIY